MLRHQPNFKEIRLSTRSSDFKTNASNLKHHLCPLCGCVGVGVLAMLIVAVFLDNIDWERASQFREKREPFCQTFLATFRLLKDWRLLALIPLTMYSGFEQSFLSGEYTKAGRLTLLSTS